MDRDAKDQLAAEVARAVERRLGAENGTLGNVIAQEVAAAMASPGADTVLRGNARSQSTEERIVITANGHNRPGVVARLTAAVDEFSGDIRDISQTIVGDYFTMIIVVDISGATAEGARFANLRERLRQVGQDLGVHVVALHDDILSSMHSV